MKCTFIVAISAFLCTSLAFAQKKDDFGKLTIDEQNFTTYDKDSTVSAVVLYEKGENYFKVKNRYIWLVKEYHGKIKILDEKGFEEGTISIPYYKGEKSSEKVEDIRAVTHNGTTKMGLRADQIFENTINERWSEKKFTFPNIKKGAILEYQYTIRSPFIYHLNGWDFQSNIPKIYSEFNAQIPGNYVYNRSLGGSLKLNINDSKIKKACFRIEGYEKAADCEVLKYAMKDIPAFKEEEFMLASSNYISRIDFELSEHHRLNGITDKYTKSWKDVDREFRSDKDIGRQLTKKGFFEKNVPESLLTEGDAMTKAQNIYKFVQDHYTWNGKYGIYRDIRVKAAFEAKKGNIGEINISLINLLNAAGIPTQLMLTSTRKNGMPKKSHPVISDFNYVLAKANIDGEDYLLDASDKFVPFGMLPYRSLNYYGRVMDFKNASYWLDIKVGEKSKSLVRSQFRFNLEENKVIGILDEINMGYDAIFRRKKMNNYSEEAYLEYMEDRAKGALEIVSYKPLKERSHEKQISERFEFEIDDVFVNETIYLDPFLMKFFEKDPFLSEERQFPIDFGYNRNYEYVVSIILPEGYEATELPENKIITLPENMGILKFTTGLTANNISVMYSLVLNKAHFVSEIYPALKDLFKYAIDAQNNSIIVLKKKDS